jgi:hypothetical protein
MMLYEMQKQVYVTSSDNFVTYGGFGGGGAIVAYFKALSRY